MVLIDTSVWIEVFRREPRIAIDDVADLDEVVTCLPVVQEVLQGFADERAFRVARDSILSLPIVASPLEQEVFAAAVDLFRSGRRAGLTIRSSVDCLIAACAIRHGLTVAHHDRDFRFLSRVSPLDAREVLPGL